MRKMMRYGKAYGGADPQMIEGDVFRIIVKVPEFGPAGDVGKGAQEAQSRAQSGAQSDRIIELLESGSLSAAELVDGLGLKSKSGALKRSLQQLLDDGLAEYTIPDKPSSRLQKYRLTEKGKKALRRIKKDSA